MADVLYAYAVGTAVSHVLGLIVVLQAFDDQTPEQRRWGARLALTCWAWPIWVAALLWLGLRALWRLAAVPVPTRKPRARAPGRHVEPPLQRRLLATTVFDPTLADPVVFTHDEANDLWLSPAGVRYRMDQLLVDRELDD